MKKKSLLVSSILALAMYSCQVESVDVLPQGEDSKSARITTGCSAPYSGVSKGWTAGSFSLPTDAQSDKKYVWRTPSRPSIKFNVKLNTNYPITVRCIGVKGVLSETYELYDGCYELSANGSLKDITFNAPGSFNWLGNWIYTYDYFDFEIIVKNRNGAGKTNTVVPVTIACCASQNGQCLGDELSNFLL